MVVEKTAVRKAKKAGPAFVVAPEGKANGSGMDAAEAIARVRELAWAGQHVQAIELASQLLAASRIKATLQMDFLDLRAESFIAQGKLDLAAKDAAAMVRLANTEKTAVLKAQALNRNALVQMRRGDLKAAVRTATSALKISQQSKHNRLIAQSLLQQSEARGRAGQIEAAIRIAQHALTLFQELGDLSGAGRAHWVLAGGFFRLNRAEESRRAARAALELCRQAGDQYGIGNALNTFSHTDVDIADRIQHLHRSHDAFEIAGYVERQSVALANLALAYFDLGLYPHSLRLQNEHAEIDRAIGAKLGLTYALANSIETELILGSLDAVRLHLRELEKLVPGLGDPVMEMSLFSARAGLAFAAGDLQSAIRHQKLAVKTVKAGQTGGEHVALTELARMYLVADDPAAALKATNQATALHRGLNFARPDGLTSQAIWWRHAQALSANRRGKEAREALDRAYDFLLASIANIRDVGLRRNALNKDDVNRELVQFWVKDGARRKLPKERLFAHLNIESSLREPFERLADTGLRLNALKTAAEIQTFIVEEATELIGGERVLLILE
jgi:tetratricopeptide (TPR) repeat protein